MVHGVCVSLFNQISKSQKNVLFKIYLKNMIKKKLLKIILLSFPVKPLSVLILTKEREISADRRYEVECRSIGSRPEAVITWWKGNRQMKRISKNVSTTFFILYSKIKY